MSDELLKKRKSISGYFDKHKSENEENLVRGIKIEIDNNSFLKDEESFVHSRDINIVGNIQNMEQEEDGFVIIPKMKDEISPEERTEIRDSYNSATEWIKSFANKGNGYENALLREFADDAKSGDFFRLSVYYVVETGKDPGEMPKKYRPNLDIIKDRLEPSSFFNLFRAHSHGFKKFDYKKLSAAMRTVQASREFQEANRIVELVMGGIGDTMTLGGVTAGAAGLFQDQMDVSGLTALLGSGATISLATAALTLFGGIASGVEFVNTVSTIDSVSKTDAAISGVQSLNLLTTTSSSATTTATTLTTVSAATTIAAGALSLSAGGLTTAVGLVSAVEVIREKNEAKKARKIFNDIKIKRRIKGASFSGTNDPYEADDESDTKSKTTSPRRTEKYEEGILELQRRISNRKGAEAGTQAVAGSMLTIAGGLTLSGAGLPVAAVLSMAAGVTLLTGKIISSIMKKTDFEPVIDQFLNCEKLYNKKSSEPAYRDLKKSQAIELIRQEEMAKLGFCSRKDMVRYIYTVYSNHIYNIVFGSDTDPKEKEGYTSLLRSLGLKVQYKNREYTPGQKKERSFFERRADKKAGIVWENMPTQEMIFQKLMK